MKGLKAAEIIVVGGGAAGLIAAKRAAELGAIVSLLEKNERLGTKILISGGGKCNLTHSGGMEEIRAQFRANEARFLKPSFYRFSNEDFLSILHGEGISTYIRPDGRVFPVDPYNARDVVAALERVVRRAVVKVVCSAAVTGLEVKEGRIAGVRIGDNIVDARRVIVAVGGSSYPATGTTGDGWRWAAEVGHSISPIRPALAPIYLVDPQPDWSGIALRDVILRARTSPDGKEFVRWRGDLLFTHRGLSGPCALGISREIADQISLCRKEQPVVEVDLAPDVGYEELRSHLHADMLKNPSKPISAVVDHYLPNRLKEQFLYTARVDIKTVGGRFSNKALNYLCTVLKGWSLGYVHAIPLERGEVVAGGICLDEVDPKTMESRIVKGLYLCGEVLDIAGPVGGYNLQAAWSTGFVAGDAAAKQN